ncbi:MAG: CcmD family protein [Deltaproteobacteria bacterium]
MSYLFWAHAVCWAGLFIYVYSLNRKGADLEKQIEALQREFKK